MVWTQGNTKLLEINCTKIYFSVIWQNSYFLFDTQIAPMISKTERDNKSIMVDFKVKVQYDYI